MKDILCLLKYYFRLVTMHKVLNISLIFVKLIILPYSAFHKHKKNTTHQCFLQCLTMIITSSEYISYTCSKSLNLIEHYNEATETDLVVSDLNVSDCVISGFMLGQKAHFQPNIRESHHIATFLSNWEVRMTFLLQNTRQWTINRKTYPMQQYFKALSHDRSIRGDIKRRNFTRPIHVDV